MLEKTVNIGGKEVKFKSSAAVPRIYRTKFGRDIFKDLTVLENSFSKAGGADAAAKGSTFPIEDLELFENIAYVMAYHADPETVPGNIEQWLDQFEIFSIYEVLPDILELWGSNMATTSTSKKKGQPAAVK